MPKEIDADALTDVVIEQFKKSGYFDKIAQMKAETYSASALLYVQQIVGTDLNQTTEKFGVLLIKGTLTQESFELNDSNFATLKDAFRDRVFTNK